MSDKTNYKLPFASFGFEITRECNMNCKHCMRGEPQKHTISKEIINLALDGISYINNLYLTGGEPFLKPEMIEYLFTEIIKRKIHVNHIGCITNGTIKDICLANSFNQLTEYIAEQYGEQMDKKQLRTIGRITVSCDDFHTLDDVMDTLKFYRKHLNQHTIIVKEVEKQNDHILMLGRALKNVNVKDAIKKNIRLIYPVCPYKIEIRNNEDGEPVYIDTSILVGWDGKILIGEDDSYAEQDSLNYGNIKDDYICNYIKKGLGDSLFTKREATVYNHFYSIIRTNCYTDEYSKEYCEGALEYFDAIYIGRKTIKELFQFLAYDLIVECAYADFYLSTRTKPHRLDTLEEWDKTLDYAERMLDYVTAEALKRDPTNFMIEYLIKKNNKAPISEVVKPKLKLL